MWSCRLTFIHSPDVIQRTTQVFNKDLHSDQHHAAKEEGQAAAEELPNAHLEYVDSQPFDGDEAHYVCAHPWLERNRCQWVDGPGIYTILHRT